MAILQNPLVIGGAIALAVIILVVGVITIRRQRRKELEERLQRFTDINTYDDLGVDDESNEPSQLTMALDKALTQREFGKNWKLALAKADLKITVIEFFALHVIAMILFFGIATVMWGVILGVVGGVVGFFAPRIYVARRQKTRLIRFEEQLPDTLGLWVNGLRSGYSVLQAMEAIGRESPEPTATEFRRVVQEVQLGISMEDALDHMLKRMESEDLDLVITAVNIQREVGGNLAEILDVIAHTIRERIKLKGEIRVLTSQGRYTGWFIGLLPVALALFLTVINREYMSGLFENRMCGWPMIGIGLGLIASGMAVIQRIVDIDY
ncbi:MAG: type II secretion system F family protein [Anaerolineae bacterium]|nr:type II secretion system F family protein [Anaerolineae bacterium]